MARTKKFHTIMALIVLSIIALGGTNWVFHPQGAWVWFVGMATMPCIWLIALWRFRRRPLHDYGDAERRFFVGSIYTAGGIVASAMLLRLVDQATSFEFNGVERVWGIAIGILLIFVGNIVPKILSPLSSKYCSDAQAQVTQRFAGWSLVLAGLIYAGLWMFAPFERADRLSFFVMITVLVLVILRYLWAMQQRRHA